MVVFQEAHACVCMLNHFSRVWLFVTPWTIVCQASLSMGFSRQEYWSGFAIPSSRESSWPRDRTHTSHVSCIGKWVLYHECHLENSYKAVKSVFFFPPLHMGDTHGRDRQDFLSMVRLVSPVLTQFTFESYSPAQFRERWTLSNLHW